MCLATLRRRRGPFHHMSADLIPLPLAFLSLFSGRESPVGHFLMQCCRVGGVNLPGSAPFLPGLSMRCFSSQDEKLPPPRYSIRPSKPVTCNNINTLRHVRSASIFPRTLARKRAQNHPKIRGLLFPPKRAYYIMTPYNIMHAALKCEKNKRWSRTLLF